MNAAPQIAAMPRRLGAWLIVTCALVRALAAHSATPWWELDPLTGWRPETTLTPALGLLLDFAVWLGALMVILSVRKAGEPVRWKSAALVFLGAIGVVLHGAVLRPLTAGESLAPRGDFASLLTGSAWAAAIVGAWALLHIASDRALRQAAGLTLLAVVAMLCAKGAYQALVEHPRVVASFDADPGAMLASKGWEPDSPSARLFERRLRQVEATGWFGLSNVYGSVVGACAAAWILLSIGAIGARFRRIVAGGDAGLIVLVALAACAALALSGSKGAIGAAAIGLGVVLATIVLPLPAALRQRLAPWLGPVIAAAVLALVLVRGAVGERIGELSLLFRWQYMQGAAQIIADHPVLGVGPAGFKDAYLLAKPPLSPEEVESPHSIFFDLIARLGIFGAAWALVWVSWLWSAGARLGDTLAQSPNSNSSDSARGARWWIASSLTISIIASLAIEWPVIGLDFALLLAVSAVVGMIGVFLTLRLAALDSQSRIDRWIDRAFVAAAFALGAHAIIEVTPVTPASAPWFFAIFAIAAARPPISPVVTDADPRPVRAPALVCALFLIAGAAFVGWRGLSVWRWETNLHRASEALRPVGEFHVALADAHADPTRAAAEVGRLAASVGLPTPRTQSEFEALLRRLRSRTVPPALTALDAAATLEPTAWDARFAAARLELALAIDLAAAGDDGGARRRADGALARVAAVVDVQPNDASAWGRLGATRLVRAGLATVPSDAAEERAAAAAAWTNAARLDPHSLGPALALWRLAIAQDQPDAARQWGARALEIDRLLRLDPLKGLTEAERSEIEAGQDASAGDGSPPSGDAQP